MPQPTFTSGNLINWDSYNKALTEIKLQDNYGTAFRILNEAEMYPEQVLQLPAPTGSSAYGYKNYADGAIATWYSNYSSTVENVPDVVSQINSNSGAGQTNTYNWQFSANTDFSGGGGGGSTGSTFHGSDVTGAGGASGAIAFLQNTVTPAVAAAGLGIKLGKVVDSALYNANPDFWDNIGLSTLNPKTWNSITMDMSDSGWEGVLKRGFNAIFGLNTEDKTSQMYIDADAAAYLAQYMQENGVFASGAETGTTGKIEGVTPDYPPFNYSSFPYGSGAQFPTNYQNRYGIANYTSPVYCYRSRVDSLGYYYLFLYSKESFTYSEASPSYPTTARLSNIHDKPVWYAKIQFKTEFNSAALGVVENRDFGLVAGRGYDILYTGEVTTTPAIDGITNQDGATQPDFSGCTTPADYKNALQQQYPDLFNNAITQDVAQPDGSVVRHTYIPVGTATGTGNQTTTNPDTTGQSQTDTKTDTSTANQTLIQTLVDLLTKTFTPTLTPTKTTNPPDTGDGNTPPVVVPTGSASALWSVYNPTQAQLNSFGAWLWSSNFIDQVLKLFNNPMQSIIGVHKIFAQPAISGSGNIVVGYLDSGVGSNLVGAQYTTVNCGSVSVREQFGNVFDYTDTQVRLYLPFIGIVDLDTSDVMRGTVSVVYHVDVITGACLAEVRVTRDGSGGTLYQFAGDASVRYPISSGSYMGIVAGIASAVGGVASAIATGGATLPLAAGAVAGGLSGAKTNVQHSGSFSGNAGAMGAKKPYFIIERPQTMIADGFGNYQGKSANVVRTVAQCSGYFKMSDVHTDSISGASAAEVQAIKTALESGVIK